MLEMRGDASWYGAQGSPFEGGPHTSAGRCAGTLCRRAARGTVVVTRKPTSRSATFSARLRPPWARPQGAQRPKDPQGWCSEHVCHNEQA